MRVEVKCQRIKMNDGIYGLLHMPCCFCFRFEGGREADLDGAWIWLALLELPAAGTVD